MGTTAPHRSGSVCCSPRCWASAAAATAEPRRRTPTRPTSAAPSAGDTLFTDPFDDDANGWALPETENSRTEVLGGDFVWEAKRAAPDLRPHVLAAPLADAFDRGDGCRCATWSSGRRSPRSVAPALWGCSAGEVRDTDSDFQWYEFVARDGFAAIRRADCAGHLDVLAVTKDVDLPLGRRPPSRRPAPTTRRDEPASGSASTARPAGRDRPARPGERFRRPPGL